jgi:hypothetical protein
LRLCVPDWRKTQPTLPIHRRCRALPLALRQRFALYPGREQ